VNTATRTAILALVMPVGGLAAQSADSAAISKLLDEVKVHSANAEDDAATLESFTISKLSWQSHATQLNQIEEHVNDLIRDSNQMTSMRDQGSPWQQEAIDRISSLLPEMALHLTVTINHLNDNKSQIHMQPYRDYARMNYTLISKAHHLITDLVDYGEAKVKIDSLDKELQLSTPATTGA
jgi:hypothetical protein